jgi:hypothetical protein
MKSTSRNVGGRRVGVGTWLTAWLVACLVFASGVSAAPKPALRGLTAGTNSGQAGTGFAQSTGNAPAVRPGSGTRKNPNIVIDPNLVRQLSAGGTRDFAVEFVERPDLSAAYSMDWQARGRYVHERLKEAAERSQAKVVDLLQRRGERFETFVVKNVILVRGGSYQTMESLLSFDEIKRVTIPPQMGLILPEAFASPDAKVKAGPRDANAKVLGTNIEWVQADDVWAQGITGDGAVVGVIDSGVRYDHEALVTQYRGNLGGGSFDHNFSWLDPEGGSPFPAPASSAIDDQHGTHVAGTIVGDDFDANEANRDRVGMAPGAKWIACQGFPASGSVDAALLGCGDFMLAPTDLTGANPDPDRRPMAVNNSWGACTAGVVDDFYTDVVDSWNAAGIIPVFAAGNASNCGYSSPPGLGTVGSPGAYPDVFTIGSTGNANGLYAPHSNWGPTEGINIGLPNFPDVNGFPQLKPNVVAPGVSIRSTIGTGTATYDSAGWTGTSMSTPHVVGLMALMFEAADCLVGDFGRVGTIIQQTARPIDYASGTEGGAAPPGPGNYPNYATGWGEIDAFDAVQVAIEECGPQGFISGTVTETGSGLPIEGALVEIFVDEMVRVYTTTTDADGDYTRRVPVPEVAGTYTVRVSRYGYIGESATGIDVVEEQTTTQDFVLDAAAEFEVSGIVRDSTTGWPLHARLDISGYPNGPVWSDPVSGAYSVELAEGIEYSISVTATVPGYEVASADVGPLGAPLSQDFALDANLTACLAPGYVLGAPVLTEDFEVAGSATTPPAGWTISTLGAGTTPGWRFGTALGSSFFPIPAHTRYAAANDDDNNTNATEDYLISPVINLGAATSPILRFDSRHSGEFGSTAQVQASTDGGATWTVVVGNAPGNGRTGAWTTQTMSLAALAGEANVRLRFHHDDNGDWADGWAVDDISVVPGCIAPAAGGLVTGRVVDENTGDGINGAVVSTDAGEEATTFMTADPAVGDGFYAVFAAPGSVDVDAAAGPTVPSGYGNDSATVPVVDEQNTGLDLELPAAQLVVVPAGGPSATVELGQNTTQPFSVQNEGGVAADYQIVLAGLVEDFENPTFPPAGWTVVDNGTGCPWDTNVAFGLPNYAGGQGLSATVSSDACGSGSVVDASLISPPFSLEFSTQASLDFVLSYRHLGSSRFDVDFSSNNGASWTTIFSQTTSTSATGPGTPVSLDLASQLGASQARLRLRYRAGWDWWVQVDQLRLFADANSVAWLGISPTAGSLAPSPSSFDHTAVFRGSQVDQPGFFQVPLRVVESTPYPPPTLAPSMTVTAPASFGTLSGTVTGLGACDADLAPIQGANVVIQGSSAVYQTTTDASGQYSWQLDSAQSPVSVTVSAPGHVAGSASGIAVSPGSTSTADIDLRATLPCFDVLEDDVSATLESGDTATDILTLVNTGAGEVDPWMVQVGGDPNIVSDQAISQSTDRTTILSPNTVACPTGPNGFYRLYSPADEGFLGEVTIESVRFAVETVEGAREVEIGLYAFEGPIDNPTAVTQLGDYEVLTIPVGTNYIQTVPLSAPVTVSADTRILVEVWTADGNAAGAQFFPGSNDAGESAPSYIIADACGATWLTPFADLGFPEVQLILDLEVEGAKVCGAGVTPVDWLSVDPADGSIAPDSDVAVEATFDATGGSSTVGLYEGVLCVNAAASNGSRVIPATMDVIASVPDIDVSIDVTESGDPVQAGTALDYTVEIGNAGPSAADDVEVDATLGAGVSYVGFAGTDWSCTEAGGAVNCAYSGSVAPAGSAPSLTIQTTPLIAGAATTDFEVSATGDDSDLGNNIASVTTTVTPAPDVDMALNASVTPDSTVQGTNVQLRLISANVGSDDATGVEIAITLPAGVGYVSASGSGWSCAAAGSDVVCELSSDVSSGFAPTLDVTLSTGGGFGSVQITSVVSSSQADGNPANNSATVDLDVTAASDEIFEDGFEGP